MSGTICAFVRLGSPIVILALLGAGCITIKKGTAGADGGIYRSPDQGEHWAQLSAVPTPKGVGSIAGVDVAFITFDPSDRGAVYIGTQTNGMWYSYDGGAGWRQAEDLMAGRVPSIAVSPRDKCTIFAAQGNRVFKSTDCNRTFQPVYTDTRPAALITGVVVDHYNPRTVYIATAKGDLFRSLDEGSTWSLIKIFEEEISQLLISSNDSRIVFAALKTRGMWRSTDGGATWTEIRKQLEPFQSARTFYRLAEVKSSPGVYLHASRFGVLRTANNGDTWEKIDTLTPPGSAVIFSLAVNPKNGQEFYYATANTLYRTLDGGVRWTPKKLPTSRAGAALAIDPEDGKVIYLGGITLKK